jgi:beta-galactosidase
MGFLVMDETFDCWYIGKDAAPFGFQNYFKEWHEREISDMVLRDRNHPSVIFWSIGNEIKEQWFPNSTNGGEIARELVASIRKLDNTRFTTSAFNFVRDAEKKGMTEAVDVVGFNYTIDAYDGIKQKHPDWFYLASETTSQFDSRGVYHLPIDSLAKTTSNGQASAFDDASGGTTHEEAWQAVKKRPWMSGLYIWTGFDYFGEPAPYGNVAISSYFGIFDLCGFPKDSYYYYKSQWTKAPMVHLLPHWNWKAGQMVDVVAYSNCDEVKLYLNNLFLESRNFKESKILSLRWKVPFAAGELRAEGYRNGKLVATDRVQTAGEPLKIVLSADRQSIKADGKDLSFVTVRITDENATLVPDADNLVHFELEGEGKIIGLANGNPMSLEPAKGSERRAFSGMCLVVVQSTGKKGEVVLKATSPGMLEAKTILHSN